MRVIAIDPGVTTGYCYAAIVDGVLLYCPFQAADDVEDFWERLAMFKPQHIIMEDFEFRGGARKGLELFPVQLIGIANLYSMKTGKPLYLQGAGDGKSYYTDNILKQRELYIRGIPHGMDASRHLLQWATFKRGYELVPKSVFRLVPMERFDLGAKKL